jgi:pimeloyl-ACP methyl ester carboxylesterase
MTARNTGRTTRLGRWVRIGFVVAAVIGAALAVLAWRPLTVLNGFSRARLWVAGVRGGTAQAGPYRLHYLVAGSGRTVILLHGLGGEGLQWGDYIPALAEGARVYAPDLLGFGTSDRPDVDYSTPLQTDVLRGFMDSEGIQQADLVGMSMGGWIAASFARLYPDRVRRLVLVDAAGLKFDPGTPEPFVARSASDLRRLMRLGTPRATRIPSFLAPGFVREMQPLVPVVERHLQNKRLGRGTLDGKLSSVTMPVLLVWGALDQLSPLAYGQEFHRQIPQSQLVILENCGHLAVYDCRSHAQPVIRTFLAAAQPEQGGIRTVTVPW